MSSPEGLPTDTEIRGGLRRGAWSSALSLGVVVLAVVAVARSGVDEGVAARLAQGVAWERIGLALLAITAAFACMAASWRQLMPPGNRAAVPGLTAMLLAGLLMTYALPGPVGELCTAWFAHRRYGVPLADSLTSGLASRVVGLASAAVLALVTWLTVDLPVSVEHRGLVAGSAVAIGLGGLVLAALAAAPRAWQALASRVLNQVARVERLRSLATRAERGVVVLTEALAGVVGRGRRAYARAATADLLAHACMAISVGLVASSMGISLDPGGLVFAYALAIAGGVVLVLLPGSQLTRDVAFGSLLVGACGIAVGDAIVIAAGVRLLQGLLQAAGGLVVGGLMLREDRVG